MLRCRGIATRSPVATGASSRRGEKIPRLANRIQPHPRCETSRARFTGTNLVIGLVERWRIEVVHGASVITKVFLPLCLPAGRASPELRPGDYKRPGSMSNCLEAGQRALDGRGVFAHLGDASKLLRGSQFQPAARIYSLELDSLALQLAQQLAHRSMPCQKAPRANLRADVDADAVGSSQRLALALVNLQRLTNVHANLCSRRPVEM